MEETDTVVFNKLADEYQRNKNDMIENTLKAGRVICFAKVELVRGQFLNWLQDFRVSEGVRTSQRLMAIHADFGHLLDDKNNLRVINGLGITHLLELKKLPDRFRKDIEVLKEVDGKEIREIKRVIDERKLGDFLDTPVNFQGKMTQVKDLPLVEMNKQIKQAQGVFEPDVDVTEIEVGVDSTPEQPLHLRELGEVNKQSNGVKVVNEKLSSLLDLSFSLIKDCDMVDEAEVFAAGEKDIQILKNNIKRFKSNLEAIYVKLNGFENG